MYNTLAVPQIGSFDTYKAKRIFENSFRFGTIKSLISAVRGKSRRLLEYKDVTAGTPLNNQHYIGIQIVPVRRIRGTLGKADSFDIDFHPLHKRSLARWINIASAMIHDKYLPPVELIQVGDVYFVSDGHHRVSVAQALQKDYIDAVVTVRE